MSRYRDPQPQVVENHSYLFNLRPNISNYGCLNTLYLWFKLIIELIKTFIVSRHFLFPISVIWSANEKWNESGFRPPLCTYRLTWARRTSWGWWDDWDDTVLQTQDLKFEPWRSEAEHATSRSRRLPTILTFTRGWGRNSFFQTAETGNRTPNSGVRGSGANHHPRAPALIG